MVSISPQKWSPIGLQWRLFLVSQLVHNPASKRKKSLSVKPGCTSGFSTSSIYSNLSFSSSNDSKSSVFGTPGFDGQSPTLDQVLCMGTNNYQLRCDRSYSDGDYDLSELISSLQLLGSGSGVDKFPRTPSPDEDSYRQR